MIMLRFVFRRWSSKKIPTFPVELDPGQTYLPLVCPVCSLQIHFGKLAEQHEDVHCQSSPATCARARGTRTRGNDA